MKKILMIVCLLVLTGCRDQLVCTLETTERNYESEINEFFEFKKDKIVNAYSTNIMTFKTKEETEMYLETFKLLDKGYSVTQKNEYQLELRVSKEFENYKKGKEQIIEEFENQGYSCTKKNNTISIVFLIFIEFLVFF